MRAMTRRAPAAFLSLLLLPVASVGQGSRMPGAVEAGLLLRQLDGVKRVLVVAAHPDDEDTALLATLARGWGVEAAYFSFTRGEGGQNLIGTELGEGLGIIRTGELLAARAIDGAEQYFGRAFDFGYSKTAQETLEKWPRELVLSDLVWTIRRFRPHVIISMWSGTPRDGHGHHQVSGMLTREAWEAAGDPGRFPEQLARVGTWTPLKLYRRTFFDPDAATLAIRTGTLDPLLGRSYHQIAMDSRSQHRSQDFGTAQSPGPRETHLALLETRVPSGESDALLAGVDTTLATLVEPLGSRAVADIGAYREWLAVAGDRLSVADPAASLRPLISARAVLLRAMAQTPDETVELGRELFRRKRLLERAILAVAGVRVELRARDDVWVPGQTTLVEARVWSGGEAELELAPPEIRTPPGWTVAAIGPADEVAPDDTGPFGRFFRLDEPVAEPGVPVTVPAGEQALWRYRVTVPDDAETTAPYFLSEPRDGDLYRWPDSPETRALPFRPPVLGGSVTVRLAARGIEVSRVGLETPVRFRGVTGSAGEFWRPIHVAPRLSVTPGSNTWIWPVSDTAPRDIAFRVTNRAGDVSAGALEIDAPTGWAVEPARRAFSLEPEGEATLLFRVTPTPDTPEGEFFLRPRIVSEAGPAPARDVTIIDYPHIEPRLVASDAAVRIVRFPVQVAERSIGYVMGSGDDGPSAIRQLGLDVELIEPDGWEADRLDRFDTIVVGVRAYEVREDLIAANEALLDWVERGGTLIVQYNRYEFNDDDYAPYPITIGAPAPRVTDETARVTLREADGPAFREPNRITTGDFEGWVQERGLYFPTEWDPRYRSLLEMADPDEPDRLGSLLAAPHGDGLYIHTSLSLFRQLPAGVPGAFRLLANLLSLDGRRWRAAS